MDDFFNSVGVDVQMEAEETVDAAFVIFGIAGRQLAVLFCVGAFGEEAGEVEKSGGGVRNVGGGEGGEDVAGGAGNGFGFHDACFVCVSAGGKVWRGFF